MQCVIAYLTNYKQTMNSKINMPKHFILINKTILFIFCFVISLQFVLAQNGIISGSIKDSINKVGVAYAHVVILNDADNSFTGMGGISNEKGVYKIDNLPYGIYSMKISSFGFKTKTISGIQLTPEQKRVNIDAVIEIDIMALDEVIVSSDRPLIELKPNKKIIYIDPTAATGGESVAEFLKSIPEIRVDGDDVTLKTYTPTILVNGKPAGPAMKDLTQVPASLISTVEVITNPSVRYNPEGLGGIINLKTRKMADGINGIIQGSASSNNKYYGAGTLNFRTKKWNFFANIYDSYLGNKETGSVKKYIDSAHYIYQTNLLRHKINRVTTRIGTDFELDSMNVFTFYWEYSKRSGNDKLNYKQEETEWLMSRTFGIEQKSNWDSRDHNLSFNYLHTFKNKGELDIDISQFFNYEPRNANMFFRENSNTLSLYNEFHYDAKVSNVNLNYSAPIFKTWELETGTSLEWRWVELYDSLSGNFELYEHFFRMNRLINAYYLSLAKSFGKFDITAGIRGEYVYQKLYSFVHLSNNNKFDFFPNLGLNYRINDEINLNLSYGRRIRRPRIQELTPYATINYFFPSERYIGNTDLKPAYTNSIDLGAYFDWSKLLLSTSASYMITKNDVASVYYVQDNLTHITQKNIATTQKILFNISFDYHSKLFKIYRPILTVSFVQNFYDSPDTAGKNIHKRFFNYDLNLYNIFLLPKGFSIYLDITYYPRTYFYTSIVKDRVDIWLKIRKTFWKRLTVQISFFNILNSKYVESMYGDGFTSEKMMNENTMSVNLGIMYQFGKPIKTRAKVNLNTNRIETQ
jgi:outer membrane receptor protein involved in Fe transport